MGKKNRQNKPQNKSQNARQIKPQSESLELEWKKSLEAEREIKK